jgi:cobalt/nickel transport system permease protein
MSVSAERKGRKERQRQFGWIERTLADVAGSVEQAVFSEEHAAKDGWLQRRDPRAKLLMFLMLVLAAGLSNSLPALLIFYGILLLMAGISKIPFDFFVKRVWLGIPFFAGIMIVPAIFFTDAPRLFDLPLLWGLHFGPSLASIVRGLIFIMRVGVSVSLAVLLILCTPWADMLKSLHALRVPQVFILLLSMTYRYIFLFLHAANSMFEARKSRTVGRTSGNEQRGWVSNSMGNLMQRSFKMSSDVYAAMMARGFTGTIHSYSTYHMTATDWLALVGTLLLAVAIFVLGRLI